MEYEQEFQIGTKKKIAADGYVNVDLKICGHQDNINTLTITNVTWSPGLVTIC